MGKLSYIGCYWSLYVFITFSLTNFVCHSLTLRKEEAFEIISPIYFFANNIKFIFVPAVRYVWIFAFIYCAAGL